MTTGSPGTLSDRLDRLKTSAMERKGSFPRSVNPFARSVALWLASDVHGRIDASDAQRQDSARWA